VGERVSGRGSSPDESHAVPRGGNNSLLTSAKRGPPGDRLGVRAYAEHRGCTPKAVRKALERGQISKDDNGLIDVAGADACWPRDNAELIAGAAPGVGTTGGTGVGTDDAEVGTADGDQPIAFAAARIRKEVALAGLREYELAQLRSELVTLEFMDNELEGAFDVVRARLLNLPSIAPRLAELTGIAAIEAALQAEVDRILVTLSTTGAQRVRRPHAS